MGANIETQKSHAQFLRYKNFQRNYAYAAAWEAGTITNPQIVLNTQKNHYLNQATQKVLAKIFLQKIPTSKISNPKISLDHLCHLKSGVPSPPPSFPPPGAQALFAKSASEIRDFRNMCYNEGAVIEWFRFFSLPLLYSYHFSLRNRFISSFLSIPLI